MAHQHNIQQAIESGGRVIERAASETRLAVSTHRIVAREAGDAADRVRETAEQLKALAAERRAELERAQGQEGGPH